MNSSTPTTMSPAAAAARRIITSARNSVGGQVPASRSCGKPRRGRLLAMRIPTIPAMAIADNLIAIKKPQAFSRCGPGVQNPLVLKRSIRPSPGERENDSRDEFCGVETASFSQGTTRTLPKRHRARSRLGQWFRTTHGPPMRERQGNARNGVLRCAKSPCGLRAAC
jgi:hypothetical protein